MANNESSKIKSVNRLLRIAYCVTRRRYAIRNTQYEATCYRNKLLIFIIRNFFQ